MDHRFKIKTYHFLFFKGFEIIYFSIFLNGSEESRRKLKTTLTFLETERSWDLSLITILWTSNCVTYQWNILLNLLTKNNFWNRYQKGPKSLTFQKLIYTISPVLSKISVRKTFQKSWMQNDIYIIRVVALNN